MHANRTDDEIRSLANADSVTDVMRALKSRNGPYQRLSKRSRWISLIVVGACYWVVSMVVFNLILGI